MRMKTFIKISWQFEGQHRWADAPEDVGFLRKPHRHMFHVTAKIPVNHNDRQLEFFLVKHSLQAATTKMYDFDLGNKSCEMMCEDFIAYIEKQYGIKRDVSVEVSEDGENSAIVEI